MPTINADDAELRRLVAIVSADWPADEQAEALEAALADREAALTCFRALVAERGLSDEVEADEADEADDDMRPCTACANLSRGGRCLAAERGESMGAGIATSRKYTPTMPDRPQRCGAYAPKADDPDQREGWERWPFLFAPASGKTAPARPTSARAGRQARVVATDRAGARHGPGKGLAGDV